MYWNLIWKSPGFVSCWAILTHFGQIWHHFRTLQTVASRWVVEIGDVRRVPIRYHLYIVYIIIILYIHLIVNYSYNIITDLYVPIVGHLNGILGTDWTKAYNFVRSFYRPYSWILRGSKILTTGPTSNGLLKGALFKKWRVLYIMPI